MAMVHLYEETEHFDQHFDLGPLPNRVKRQRPIDDDDDDEVICTGEAPVAADGKYDLGEPVPPLRKKKAPPRDDTSEGSLREVEPAERAAGSIKGLRGSGAWTLEPVIHGRILSEHTGCLHRFGGLCLNTPRLFHAA